jgi:hypothetical protein
MENIEGTGKLMTPQHLAALLRDAANEIDDPRGHGPGSFEGSIAWESPDSLPEQDSDKFEVIAFYRVGNDMGQGGAVVIRGDL